MQIKNFHIRLHKEHLQEDEQRLNIFLQQVHVIKTAQQLVNVNSIVFWAVLVFYKQDEHVEQKSKFDENSLPDDAKHRYETLRKWRSERAHSDGLVPYMLFHNAHLAQIALECPTTIEEIAIIKGVGLTRANKYGDEILALLNG